MNLRRYLSPFSRRKYASEQEKKITEIFRFTPKQPQIYERAFRHKSKYQNPGENNERQEFLGDCVYDLIVAEYLYDLLPENDEGELTRLKSYLVSRKFLNSVAEKTGITALVEAKIHGKKSSTSIGGNALEAIIAALYEDKGFDFTKGAVIQNILIPYAKIDTLTSFTFDPKSKVYEFSHQKGFQVEFTTFEGVEHDFESVLLIDSQKVSRGGGRSKKEAEKAAASEALKTFFDNIT